MEGEDHRHYRKAIHSALKGIQLDAKQSVLQAIAETGFRDYAEHQNEHRCSPDSFSSAMSAMATSMLT